ncbi:MAG: hypothetical protein Q4C96_07760 [Planctomycetia bacterium]|nr:hypothetical protein [Planctomycetia bacterium]
MKRRRTFRRVLILPRVLIFPVEPWREDAVRSPGKGSADGRGAKNGLVAGRFIIFQSSGSWVGSVVIPIF